ncbi:MAG: phage tail family protein [Acidimicrobiia bacterium]|nr:phage tail family protein [Acidimicrobiia bacterium]
MGLATLDFPQYHGGVAVASYEAPRVIELDFEVFGDTTAQTLTLLEDLFAVFQPQVTVEQPLVFTLPGQPERQVDCRPRLGDAPLVTPAIHRHGVASFQLVASDPAIYSSAERQAVVTPTVASGGLTYDVIYPKVYGAAGVGGTVNVPNAGQWETWPRFVITGPTSGTFTDPTIEYLTGGQALRFNAFGGIAISAGQELLIDSSPRHRSVTLDGASRIGRLSEDSEWFAFQPGINEVRLRGFGTFDGVSMTITARDAWI